MAVATAGMRRHEACAGLGQSRQPRFEHAAHGVERTEDHDSISRVRCRPAAARKASGAEAWQLTVTSRPGVRGPRQAPPARRRGPRAAWPDRRSANGRPAAACGPGCAARSLSRMAPNTACVRGKKPIASRFCASAATDCGLCATSSTRRRLPGHDLEAAGQFDQRQPGAHRLRRDRQALAQRLERGDRAGGVEQLVGAAQRRIGQAVIARCAAAAPSATAGGRPRALKSRPTSHRSAPMRLAVGEHAGRRQRVADDRRPARRASRAPSRARSTSRSGPRYSMWSRSMLVITAQSASKALTASSRPPRPTSRITRSSARLRQRARDGQRRELEIGQRQCRRAPPRRPRSAAAGRLRPPMLGR